MQTQFEELASQLQGIEARDLKVYRMSRTHSLNAVRDARIRSATSVRVTGTGIWVCEFPVCIQAIPTPFGAPPSQIEVISTGISHTVAPPPASSQDGTSKNVEAMVQDLVKSSQTQSDTVDLEPTQIEEISSEGEISDQEVHSGTCSKRIVDGTGRARRLRLFSLASGH